MQRMADLKPNRAEAAAAAIAVDRVSHIYHGREGQVPALQDISMQVGAGRFTVIVGPSGCGKTSLLMMLAGLRRASAGTILCAGRPILEPDPNRVGVVFQEASLFPWLTALDNIEFPLSIRHAPREERRERANAMLDLVGLQGFGGRYPRHLSGGQRKRVALAQVLAMTPKLLLMDEPCASLDAIVRARIVQDVAELVEREKISVLLVTHDLEEALTLSDDVYLLSQGPRAGITQHYQVPIPRPRDPVHSRTHPAFAPLYERLWGSGFLATRHQGVQFRAAKDPVL